MTKRIEFYLEGETEEQPVRVPITLSFESGTVWLKSGVVYLVGITPDGLLRRICGITNIPGLQLDVQSRIKVLGE